MGREPLKKISNGWWYNVKWYENQIGIRILGIPVIELVAAIDDVYVTVRVADELPQKTSFPHQGD